MPPLLHWRTYIGPQASRQTAASAMHTCHLSTVSSGLIEGLGPKPCSGLLPAAALAVMQKTSSQHVHHRPLSGRCNIRHSSHGNRLGSCILGGSSRRLQHFVVCGSSMPHSAGGAVAGCRSWGCGIRELNLVLLGACTCITWRGNRQSRMGIMTPCVKSSYASPAVALSSSGLVACKLQSSVCGSWAGARRCSMPTSRYSSRYMDGGNSRSSTSSSGHGSGQDRRSVIVHAAKTAKEVRVYPCSKCGYEHSKWHGLCKGCNRADTLPMQGIVKAPAAATVEGGGGSGMAAYLLARNAANASPSPSERPSGRGSVPGSGGANASSSSSSGNSTAGGVGSSKANVGSSANGVGTSNGNNGSSSSNARSVGSSSNNGSGSKSANDVGGSSEHNVGNSNGNNGSSTASGSSNGIAISNSSSSYVNARSGSTGLSEGRSRGTKLDEDEDPFTDPSSPLFAPAAAAVAATAPSSASVGKSAPQRGWVGGDSGGSSSSAAAAGTFRNEPRSLRSIGGGARVHAASRIPLTGHTGQELGRVLGGGVVPGALVLIGGDPGVGKSTLMLQLAAMVSHPELHFSGEVADGVGSNGNGALEGGSSNGSGSYPSGDGNTVLYFSGEEMAEQVFERAVRMGAGACSRLLVMSESQLDHIMRHVMEQRPTAIVVDSINTMYLAGIPHSPGSLVQIRECGHSLMRLAKDQGVTIFIIGHVTKEGGLAGPNTLMHMVDTVLYLEGEMSASVRLLRVVKNRHGSSDEVGIFSMDANGLRVVENPNALFLASRAEGGASSVVGIIMDGNRALMGEIQALVSPQHHKAESPPARAPNGVDKNRFLLLLEVLSKFISTMTLYNQHVYINVVGGLQMKEQAVDLAIAVAVASSYFSTHVSKDLVVIGEVDLGGQIRGSFKRLDARLAAAAQMGLTHAIIPMVDDWEKLQRDPRFAGLELLPCGTLADALRAALGDVIDTKPAGMQRKRQRKSKAAELDEEEAVMSFEEE